jgi:hypothetical protein
MLGSVLATPDERFVGFGERFTGVDQRGRAVDVWAEDRRLAAYGKSTYAPLPLVLSSGGYSFLLERFERASFDLAASRPDRWSWEQQASAASILVSYGPGLKDLIAQNLQATGAPPLAPLWAFGVCKTAVGGQAEVLDEARRIRPEAAAVHHLQGVLDRINAELKEVLPPALYEELDELTPDVKDGSLEELSLAHSEILGWLEGLFQGTQLAIQLQAAHALGERAARGRPAPDDADEPGPDGRYL